METHKKLKTTFLLIFLGLFSAAIGILIIIEDPEVKQALRYHYAWANPTKESVQAYFETLPSEETSLLQTSSYTLYHAIPSGVREEIDENYPDGLGYLTKGAFGRHVYTYDVLTNENGETKKYNVIYRKEEPVEKVLTTGSLGDDALSLKLQGKFSDILQSLKDTTEQEFLENLTFSKVNLQKTRKFRVEEGSILKVGEVIIQMNNCGRENTLQLGYDTETKDYLLQDVETFAARLCKRQYTEADGYLIGTCTDCTLYPADKSHALRSDYTPDVRMIDFAPGGQSIYAKAYDDFKELYQAAAEAGYYIFVTSGYRSYATQQNTFESWVAYEMAMGKSHAAAEAAANTYSARPGFSEHQLGTALDLNSGGCGLASGCSGNQGIWDWLKENAHIYGFALSYPSDKVNDTGYIYEPWHYRWIGRELAAKYKGVERTTWLAEFLRNESQF